MRTIYQRLDGNAKQTIVNAALVDRSVGLGFSSKERGGGARRV